MVAGSIHKKKVRERVCNKYITREIGKKKRERQREREREREKDIKRERDRKREKET